MKKSSLKVGDKIAYSVQFLRNIGASHSDMARGRGEITELKSYGENFTLAGIKWDKGANLPDKVNVGNLARVGLNTRFSAC